MSYSNPNSKWADNIMEGIMGDIKPIRPAVETEIKCNTCMDTGLVKVPDEEQTTYPCPDCNNK